MYLITEGCHAGINMDELINRKFLRVIPVEEFPKQNSLKIIRRRKDGANLIELATLLAPGLAKKLVSRRKKSVRDSILRRNLRKLDKLQAKQGRFCNGSTSSY